MMSCWSQTLLDYQFTQYKVILFQKNWEPKNVASCADFLMVCHAIFPLLGRKDCVMSLEKVCRGGDSGLLLLLGTALQECNISYSNIWCKVLTWERVVSNCGVQGTSDIII